VYSHPLFPSLLNLSRTSFRRQRRHWLVRRQCQGKPVIGSRDAALADRVLAVDALGRAGLAAPLVVFIVWPVSLPEIACIVQWVPVFSEVGPLIFHWLSVIRQCSFAAQPPLTRPQIVSCRADGVCTASLEEECRLCSVRHVMLSLSGLELLICSLKLQLTSSTLSTCSNLSLNVSPTFHGTGLIRSHLHFQVQRGRVLASCYIVLQLLWSGQHSRLYPTTMSSNPWRSSRSCVRS
jgi:hypothetical protein